MVRVVPQGRPCAFSYVTYIQNVQCMKDYRERYIVKNISCMLQLRDFNCNELIMAEKCILVSLGLSEGREGGGSKNASIAIRRGDRFYR